MCDTHDTHEAALPATRKHHASSGRSRARGHQERTDRSAAGIKDRGGVGRAPRVVLVDVLVAVARGSNIVGAEAFVTDDGLWSSM